MEGVRTRFMTAAQTCGICLQPIEQQGKLDCCKHIFCLECVLRWARQAGTCPVCKATIKTVQLQWLRVRSMQKCLSEAPVKSPVYEVSQTHQQEFNFEIGARHCKNNADSLVFYVNSAIGNIEAMISRLLRVEM